LSRSSQERIPALLAALAAQAGLAILLFLSLQARRTPQEERETIFVLPPLPRPPRVAPVIDAIPAPAPRARAPALAVPPPAPSPLYVPPAPPRDDRALLQALGRSLSNCTPQKYALLAPSLKAECPPTFDGMARPRAGGQAPPAQVAHEEFWAAEREANRTPLRVPCVSLADRTVGMGPAQGKEYSVMLDPLCAIRELRK
jgi:hypothetical protein